ncbi:MAG: hypothetical protein CM1200mP30_19490 [Pseudomonadota bacterium]|nr:MAG: hypothetical protein CM1200mP30_19490 [Pseudomonadota bacterium]
MPLAETVIQRKMEAGFPMCIFRYPRLVYSKGNYPGVALPSQQNVWTSICPDPGIMLG